MLQHMYATTADVLRLRMVDNDGRAANTYECVGQIKCRLDLGFIRPGIDFIPPAEAGRIPDRTGLAFFDATEDIRSSDRLRCVSGPVTGTFEVLTQPGVAQSFSAAHHYEVQVKEVAQMLVGEQA